MFYSTTENPRLRVTYKEELKYISEGFAKIEESATCVVRKIILCIGPSLTKNLLFIIHNYCPEYHLLVYV